MKGKGRDSQNVSNGHHKAILRDESIEVLFRLVVAILKCYKELKEMVGVLNRRKMGDLKEVFSQIHYNFSY